MPMRLARSRHVATTAFTTSTIASASRIESRKHPVVVSMEPGIVVLEGKDLPATRLVDEQSPKPQRSFEADPVSMHLDAS